MYGLTEKIKVHLQIKWVITIFLSINLNHCGVVYKARSNTSLTIFSSRSGSHA